MQMQYTHVDDKLLILTVLTRNYSDRCRILLFPSLFLKKKKKKAVCPFKAMKNLMTKISILKTIHGYLIV